MKKIFVFITLLLLIVGIYLFIPNKQSSPGKNPAIDNVELDSYKLWQLIQDWRVKNNYQPYISDQQLCKLASIRLDELKTDFSHKGFYSHLKDFSYQTIGENLANDQSSEQEVLDGWIASKEHLENLERDYTHSCIQTRGKYSIQMFASY